MPNVIKIACATALPLLICACQSYSTPPIQPAAAQCQPPPPPGGVVHGPTRAQLDPAHAQRIIGITDVGDQGLIALAACQSYVSNLHRQ
jgi:hypothetical protein